MHDRISLASPLSYCVPTAFHSAVCCTPVVASLVACRCSRLNRPHSQTAVQVSIYLFSDRRTRELVLVLRCNAIPRQTDRQTNRHTWGTHFMSIWGLLRLTAIIFFINELYFISLYVCVHVADTMGTDPSVMNTFKNTKSEFLL